MRTALPTLTGQELEIMKVVWRLETATVRQVYEELLKQRRIAYTSVMTIMNILERKGHLKRRQEDRAYLYVPAKPQKQVIGSMVREFIQRVFNGSAEPLLVHLVEDEQLTEQDVEEIRRSIKSSKKPNRERSK
jgi:BlaI family transcriptional regulator, penicillinase repressor